MGPQKRCIPLLLNMQITLFSYIFVKITKSYSVTVRRMFLSLTIRARLLTIHKTAEEKRIIFIPLCHFHTLTIIQIFTWHILIATYLIIRH